MVYRVRFTMAERIFSDNRIAQAQAQNLPIPVEGVCRQHSWDGSHLYWLHNSRKRVTLHAAATPGGFPP
jgi:hypothetical protein